MLVSNDSIEFIFHIPADKKLRTKNHTIRTNPKSHWKFVETEETSVLTYIYIVHDAHPRGLAQVRGNIGTNIHIHCT
jgi:hypothetical protein